MSVLGSLSQLLEIVVALLLAPLLVGWVNQWRAWLQNKSAPPLLQPYRVLHKLFNKESVVAHNASSLFRSAPYVVFSCMLLASAIIPTLSTDLPLAPAADAIALVGLFALARESRLSACWRRWHPSAVGRSARWQGRGANRGAEEHRARGRARSALRALTRRGCLSAVSEASSATGRETEAPQGSLRSAQAASA